MRRALAEICKQLEIRDEGMLDTVASLLRVPTSRSREQARLDPQLRDRAEKIHDALIDHCFEGRQYAQ